MQGGKLFHEISAWLQTTEPALLGPTKRSSATPLNELDRQLEVTFGKTLFTPALQNLFRAVIYLWHDHLDESHSIAQEIETQDGSLVHAIMHRREADYANAKYWFRRAGHHPSFLHLARAAGELLHDESDLHSRLLPNKSWDPFAFVDAVEDAAEGQFRSKVSCLQQIQKIEFEALLQSIVERV